MSAWRSSDSAPRDGSRIIGWFTDKPIIVFWREGPGHGSNYAGGKVWYWSDGYYRHPDPDCWQPVPEAPDAQQFPAAPKPTPRPSRGTVVVSPAARRRLVEHKPQRHVLTHKLQPAEDGRAWCEQCELRVLAQQIDRCTQPFCKAKAIAA